MINTANLVGSVSRNAGGLHESVRRLVQCVAEQGVGVKVLAVEDEFTKADLESWAPVEVEAFPSSWPESFAYSSMFLPALARIKPDLTHTHGIWQYPSIATSIYCHRNRVPYMISPHGMLDPWAMRHRRWKKVLAYATYEINHIRGARCLRALCESEAQSIRLMGLKNPVAIIPNGIDLPKELGAHGALPEAPWVGATESGCKVLLFLSRVHPKKGLENLLHAWASTSASRDTAATQWCLAIAGWDQDGHEAELKRLATKLDIPWGDTREKGQSISGGSNGRLSLLFLGPQFNENKAACYSGCDAFILPSFSEGLPMVVLESWAYAKPVVMTPECNLPEGFAADAALKIGTDTDSVARGLVTLFSMSDDDLRQTGQNGARLVRNRFTWDSIAAQLKHTYEWMLGEGEKPAWVDER